MLTIATFKVVLLMANKIFFGLTAIGLPIAIIGAMMDWSPVLMFTIYSLTIIALAGLIGKSTESLAIVLGPRIGGLLNATFGNAVELIISIFALKSGLIGIVLASLTGSILGNLLLVGGFSFFIGGLKYKRQTFNINNAMHNAGLLIFSIVLAFIIPKVFTLSMDESQTMFLSVGVSITLIILYLAALFFKLFTHRGLFQSKEKIHPEEIKSNQSTEVVEEEPEWSKGRAMTILALATLAVAFISDHLVDTFTVVGETFGWSELFIGVIIVAFVGNAAEHASAVFLAYKNKMDVAVEIAVGSTLQVAMFVAPILVVISMFFPISMPLIFTWPELISMITAVLLIIMLSVDGESNWFDGLALLGGYVIMAIGFFLI